MGDFNTVGASMGEGVGGIASAAKGYANYNSYVSQGAYQRGISDVNAKLLEMQAADAQRRGDLAASNQLQVGNRIVGAQRTAIAASGVDVNSGSAANIQAGAKMMSELDALTIENNAHLEALGYRMDAISTSAQGRLAQIAARNNANQSAVAGGMGLLSAAVRAGQVADRYSLRVPVTAPKYPTGGGDPREGQAGTYE